MPSRRRVLVLWMFCGLFVLVILARVAWGVITLRSTKGSPLTYQELDANFTTLRDLGLVVPLSAGALAPKDPSTCTGGIPITIPSAGGARYSSSTCTDTATDALYATLVRVPNGSPGTFRVTGHGVHIGASPSGEALGFDVASQCRRAPVGLDDTWGTPQALTIPFTTQNRLEDVQTAVITPTGTCTPGTDALPLFVNIRLLVNTTAFVCATPTACKLLGIDVVFSAP